MEIIKILLIEDNSIDLMNYQEHLESLNYHIFTAKNSKEALFSFKENTPDLVLLDIQLEGDKMDGIELAELFNAMRKVPIIYLTGQKEMVFLERSNKTHPVNYLLKPCGEKQLEIAIAMAVNTLKNTQENELVSEKNATNLTKSTLQNQIVFHKVLGVLEVVNVHDIVYCEADGEATKVYLKGYETQVKPCFWGVNNLGFYAKILLEKHVGFVRVSKRILVNLAYIKTYIHCDREIILLNGQSLSAARQGGIDLRDLLTAEYGH
jgi:DNA-binding LytR/AlgR family response regulator